MNTSELLDMRPEQLAEKQYNVLKNDAIEILNEMARMLSNEEYVSAWEFLHHSPAGDEMGQENFYIPFDSIHKDLHDIGNVIDRLRELKYMTEKK